ncbi:hypothetical protein IB75_06050 [Nitrosococcus oceani C-27]|uniref:Uncharacterized protein n=1 Tax=Nitrosococcus oceani C-27 TaxID=314279 RepID=A0A0E2Z8K1_9GAMM|nr:hypothetical protein IB75_06050 [Nitrosococcus oceani C-27]GEM19309.1 hypothetical protein NONS58_06930 [Nitrosococcus oceani]
MVADLLRWLSRPKPRLIQSRWAVNSPSILTSTENKSILLTYLDTNQIQVASLAAYCEEDL